jgi:hypothetical protein
MARSKRSTDFCWPTPDESHRIEIVAQRATNAAGNNFSDPFKALRARRRELARLARCLHYYSQGDDDASPNDQSSSTQPEHAP